VGCAKTEIPWALAVGEAPPESVVLKKLPTHLGK
jgi:hypothetical protein